MKEVNEKLRKCMEDVTDIGIPISKRIYPEVKIMKSLSYAGRCVYSSRTHMYRIEIADYILEDEELTRNVLYHELIHTCPGGNGHGYAFKEYMHKINKLLNADVQVRLDVNDLQTIDLNAIKIQKAKYAIVCKNCGVIDYRMRKSDVIKNPHRYHCCKCGAKIHVKTL